MAKIKVRYFTKHSRAYGRVRYFWQPSTRLRAEGWRSQRLPDDYHRALVEAEKLNVKLDAARTHGRQTPGPMSPPETYMDEETGIYVIGSSAGPLKIGRSKNPMRRLHALQVANSHRLRLLFFLSCSDAVALDIESRAHNCLANERLNGEWFNVTPDAAISTIMIAAGFFVAGRQLHFNRVQRTPN